jgi:hypothetical protein
MWKYYRVFLVVFPGMTEEKPAFLNELSSYHSVNKFCIFGFIPDPSSTDTAPVSSGRVLV